jgi:hypothetical protein
MAASAGPTTRRAATDRQRRRREPISERPAVGRLIQRPICVPVFDQHRHPIRAPLLDLDEQFIVAALRPDDCE